MVSISTKSLGESLHEHLAFFQPSEYGDKKNLHEAYGTVCLFQSRMASISVNTSHLLVYFGEKCVFDESANDLLKSVQLKPRNTHSAVF